MPPGRRFRLQPGRHVHAIAVEIVAVDDQVAEVQADPEHDGGVLGLVAIGVGHGLLELDGRAQRIDRAGKLDQRTVAGQLDQPAAVAGQRRFEAFSPVGLEPGKRAVLVTAHQARVANDIRRQNSRQSPYHALARQEASPRLWPCQWADPMARLGGILGAGTGGVVRVPAP